MPANNLLEALDNSTGGLAEVARLTDDDALKTFALAAFDRLIEETERLENPANIVRFRQTVTESDVEYAQTRYEESLLDVAKLHDRRRAGELVSDERLAGVRIEAMRAHAVLLEARLAHSDARRDDLQPERVRRYESAKAARAARPSADVMETTLAHGRAL